VVIVLVAILFVVIAPSRIFVHPTAPTDILSAVIALAVILSAVTAQVRISAAVINTHCHLPQNI
jgi:hypothetical protein